MNMASMERGLRAVRRTRPTPICGCQKHRLPRGNCGCYDCGKGLVAQYAPNLLTHVTR